MEITSWAASILDSTASIVYDKPYTPWCSEKQWINLRAMLDKIICIILYCFTKLIKHQIILLRIFLNLFPIHKLNHLKVECLAHICPYMLFSKENPYDNSTTLKNESI